VKRTRTSLLVVVFIALLAIAGVFLLMNRLAAPGPTESMSGTSSYLGEAGSSRPTSMLQETPSTTATAPSAPLADQPDAVGSSPISTPTPSGIAIFSSPLVHDLPIAPQPDGMAPGFTLESAQGASVALSDYAGKSDVVLVFYRGQT
jgi:cytoskeletal protein RodZ